MAVLNRNNSSSEGEGSLLSLIIPFASLCSLIFAVLGIKLKWFRHRLTFDEIPSAPARNTDDGAVQIRGIYRPTNDMDNFVQIQRPKELPPVRVPNQTSRSKLNLPIPKRNAAPPPTSTGVMGQPKFEAINGGFFGESSNHRKRSSDFVPELPKSPPPMESEEFVIDRNTNEKFLIIPQSSNSAAKNNNVERKIIPPPPNYTPPPPIKFDTPINFHNPTPETPVLITSTSNQKKTVPQQPNGFNSPPKIEPQIDKKSGIFGFKSKVKPQTEKAPKYERVLKEKKPKEPKKKKEAVKTTVPSVPLATAINPALVRPEPSRPPPQKMPQQTPAPVPKQIDTPITFETVNIKPTPRTTGINYATTNDINDEIKIVTPSVSRIDLNKGSQPKMTTFKLENSYDDDDDDDDVWNRVQSRRNVTKAVAFTLPPPSQSQYDTKVNRVENNTAVTIEQPKTLREIQRNQRLKQESNRANQLNLTNDDEESDTEA